jgi:hypothetical protein
MQFGGWLQIVHATYDLTFPLEYSLDVLKNLCKNAIP